MNQTLIAKQFLSSLMALQNGIQNNSQLQECLNSVNAALSMSVPFPSALVHRLITALILTFRRLSKQSINQANIIYQKSIQKGIEQYLMIKYTDLLENVFKQYVTATNIDQLKQLIIIGIATSIDRIKVAQSQYLFSLLKLLFHLVFVITQNNKLQLIQTVFPNVVSNLFNHVIRSPNKSHKCTNLALDCLSKLISKLFHSQIAQVLINPLQLQQKDKTFREICSQKLSSYIHIMTEESHNYTSITNMKSFIISLVNSPGLKDTNIIQMLFKLSYILQTDLILPDSPFIQSYLRDELEKSLILVNRNMELLNHQEVQIHLKFSLKMISELSFISIHQSKRIFPFFKKLFKIVDTKVQMISGNIIPFEKMHSNMILSNNIQEDLSVTIQATKRNFLNNNVSIFRVKSSICSIFESYSKLWNQKFCKGLAQQLIEQLQTTPYSTVMSIDNMKRYVSNTIIVYWIIDKINQFSVIHKLFEIIRKSQCLTRLIPTTQEEQLLIVFSFDVLRTLYRKLVPLTSGIQLANLNILFLQVTLGLLIQDNYSIMAVCSYQLLKTSFPKNIGKLIYPFLPTIINRNRHNLPLIDKSLQLCQSQLTKSYSQYLFSEFNHLKSTQKIIFSIMPYLSPSTLRQAVLSVSGKSKWMDALRKSIDYLNGQPAPKQESFSFNSNDPENAVIKNCLGVVILQMQDKFKVQLESSPSKVLQLLCVLFELNGQMIFCSKFDEYFPRFFQLLTYNHCNQITFSKLSIISKVIKIMSRYMGVYELRKKAQILKHKSNCIRVCEKLFEVLYKKMQLDDSMKEIISKCIQDMGLFYRKISNIQSL